MVPPVSDGHHKQKLTKNTYLSAIIALILAQTTGFQNEKKPFGFWNGGASYKCET